MKNITKLFLILFSLSYVLCIHAQTGWFQQNSNTTKDLNTVIFFDENTGLAFGNNSYYWSCIILRTTTGGSNWINQYSDTNTNYISSAYFVNTYTGWAVGYQRGIGGVILKTTNSGINWFNLNSGLGGYIYSCYFIDQNTGWVVGDLGIIYKTINSGMNWVIQHNGGTGEELYSVYFLDQNTGWTVGKTNTSTQYYYEILRTTNGGTNWIYRNATGNTNFYNFTKVQFINNTTGWISYNYYPGSYYQAGVIKSTNGGLDWNANGYGIILANYGLNSLFFIDKNTGWSVGGGIAPIDSGIIIKIINGGTDWIIQKVIYSSYLLSIIFINSNTGWAVGKNGIILKTTNGGDPIGIQRISTGIPNDFTLSQNYPNPFNPSTNIEFDIPKQTFLCTRQNK